MLPKWTRRSLLAGAAAMGPCIIVRPALAADYRFSQYHNQAASGTLHKNLTAMWRAVRNETNGRVETTVYAENNKLPGGDPDALKMLISGEIQFFTLMGGINRHGGAGRRSAAVAVRLQECRGGAQGDRRAARQIYRTGNGGQGPASVSGRRLRQRHAAGRGDPAADRFA